MWNISYQILSVLRLYLALGRLSDGFAKGGACHHSPAVSWCLIFVSATSVKTPLRGTNASPGPGEHQGELWCAAAAWPPNLSELYLWRLIPKLLVGGGKMKGGSGCAGYFIRSCCRQCLCYSHFSFLLCSCRWKWASEPCPSVPWCPCPAVPTGSTSPDSTALASSTGCKVMGWAGSSQYTEQFMMLLCRFCICPSQGRLMFGLRQLPLLSDWWRWSCPLRWATGCQ